jgi:gliding motility-associated-like protein
LKPKAGHTLHPYVISKLLIIGIALFFFWVPLNLKAQTNIKINVNNGDVVNLTPLPPAGCYTWTNDNTTMGLPASGAGNIPSFTAKNKGTAPVTATIRATTIPINEYAFIGTTESQTLSVINLVTNVEETTIPINCDVSGIAVSPDDKYVYICGAKVYIGQAVTNYIIKYDIQAKKVVKSIVGGGTVLKVSPDGKLLYVNGLILDTQDLHQVGTFKAPGQSMALSPDGTKMYTTNSAYDITTKTTTTIKTQPSAYDLVISPDGKKLYLSGGSATNMYVYDIPTGVLKPINIGNPSANIAISPDGSRLYVDNYITGNVIVVDVATEQVVNVIITGFKHKGISVGLSGDRLVCIDEHGGSAIYNTTDYTLVKRFAALDYTGFGANSFGKFTSLGSCYAPNVTYTVTVYPQPAIINTSGTLSAMTTTYGTPSSPGSFTVSGSDLDGGIRVMPPTGFEVSTDQVTYKDDLTIPAVGTSIANTTVYVRLKGTAPVKSYGGNVVLTSAATTVNIAVPASTINKAPLTISSKNIKKVYGSVLSGSIITTDVLAPGLKNNETIGTITLTYGNGGKATDPVSIYVGTVKVTAATGGTYTPTNYTNPPNYVAGDMEVVGAPLTVTANDKERFYGDPNPVFTFKYSGFVNNETVAQITTLPVGNSVGPNASIGQYPITISSAVAANYTITYVPGKLTVKSTLVTVNTAFTPNDDGINDTWEINRIGQYNNCTVEVLNRYGEKVFYSIGYPVAWNGKRGSANLPTGTYYYIIKLNSSMKPLTGYLAIIR